ncbi:cysteine desulfurase [Shewanella sp. 202IG2-18]|uniref:cysteine desulfurase n=1 Tax=Parashewanella hymeniacidonis TaxID=2807618 RepID=UPI0019608F5B|nr:cysteine desulfurase [Parashewanella hymeniacidonis]MBM7072322.1 cysteine desulfurase [Parashewanella hymeniacidonis]
MNMPSQTLTPLAESLRPQFPTLKVEFDGTPLCYLDTAATSQKPASVIGAINNYYQTKNSNVHRAAHQLSSLATIEYEAVRQKIADLISANKSEEVIFTHGCTESINMVAAGLDPQIKEGDVILIDSAAHHANIVPWQQLANRTGAVIKPIPLTDNFQFDFKAYRSLLECEPKLVAITHVTNALGTLNPVSEIVKLAKAAGAITLVDGAQAIAHLDINVQEIDCDFYTFSGHKMYGPTGVGILYGKYDALDALLPLLTGGEMIKTVSFEETTFGKLPNKLEAGTPPIAEVFGLGAAVDFIKLHLTQAHQQQERVLLNYLTDKLSELTDIEVYAQSEQNVGVVAFNVKGEHHQDIGMLLDQQGIAIRCGHHCAMPLMDLMHIKGCCRVSVGIYSTQADVDTFIDALQQALELLD